MELVHYGHSCVLLDNGSTRLLIDPGNYSPGFEGVGRLDAVLVTHQHPDHLDPDRLPALLAANQQAQLFADPGSAETLGTLGLTCTILNPADEVAIGGFKVEVIGGDHARIYGDLPGIPNLGYVIDDGAFLHPGDSFVAPDRAIDVLGLPSAAPWLKIAEAIDYMRSVAPRAVFPIHQGMLVPRAQELVLGLIERTAPDRTELLRPLHGEPIMR
jgi:L-ascorbate metabolism protein UlaG (beta-lactamase superfamily)